MYFLCLGPEYWYKMPKNYANFSQKKPQSNYKEISIIKKKNNCWKFGLWNFGHPPMPPPGDKTDWSYDVCVCLTW